MGKTWTLYSKELGFYQSSEPGQFAAITTQKIAGRLDCPTGKTAKPENRIFLMYLEDMPKGFRFCKVCKPEILRAGDRLDYLETRVKSPMREPHITIWALGLIKKDRDEYEPCRWYAAMNWKRVEEGRELCGQHTLSDNYRYHKALSIALKEGKRFNISVIKHGISDIVLLWLPVRESTKKQKELVESFQNGKIAHISGKGTVQYDFSKFSYDDEPE